MKVLNKRNIILGLICIAIYIFIIIAFQFIPTFEEINLPQSISKSAYVTFLNFLIYFVLLIALTITNHHELIADFKKAKKHSFINFIGYVIAGYFLLLFFASIGNTITMLLGGSNTSINQEAVVESLTGDLSILAIITTAIIGPIVEELVFRKSIFMICDGLKINRIITILICGISFGLIHVIGGGDYVQVFPYIFMGLAISIIYNITDSIYVPILVHIMQNSISIISILYLLPYLEQIQGQI